MDGVDKPQNYKDLYGILQLLQDSHLNNFSLKTLKLGWAAFHLVKFQMKCLDFKSNQYKKLVPVLSQALTIVRSTLFDMSKKPKFSLKQTLIRGFGKETVVFSRDGRGEAYCFMLNFAILILVCSYFDSFIIPKFIGEQTGRFPIFLQTFLWYRQQIDSMSCRAFVRQ